MTESNHQQLGRTLWAIADQLRGAMNKGKRQNDLLPEHIDKIVETYQHRREEDRYSKRVSLADIAANDYNLNISRYISTAVAEPEIDLAATHAELVRLSKTVFQGHRAASGCCGSTPGEICKRGIVVPAER